MSAWTAIRAANVETTTVRRYARHVSVGAGPARTRNGQSSSTQSNPASIRGIESGSEGRQKLQRGDVRPGERRSFGQVAGAKPELRRGRRRLPQARGGVLGARGRRRDRRP